MGLSPSARQRLSRRVTPYDAVRIVLALILLTAAALKGHQLATEPVPETSFLTSRWFLVGVVEFELFFGLWLLSALYPRRTCQAAVLCFSAFACVSLYKGLSGEPTCGCFGRVPVNPWYTVILDLAALAALFLCRPARATAISPLPRPGEGPGVRARLGWVSGLFLAAGLPATLAMATYRPAALGDSGNIFGDGEFVVLEPEKWVGNRFPLLRYIDIGEQLAEGKWRVLMYHHDCPNCKATIQEYEQLRRGSALESAVVETAMIELAPYHTQTGGPLIGSVVDGKLDDKRKWLLKTPLEVFLDQAIVTSVGVH